MSDDKLSQLMDRIAKLLSLAGNNPNPQEAAVAAAKAQELAFKYNVDIAELSQSKDGRTPGDGYIKETFDLGSNHTWKAQLFWAVCKYNFGRGLVWTRTRKASIIAEPHNVEVIKHLYTYLSREIMRLGNEGWLQETGNRRYPKARSGEGEGTWKDRFGRGAVVAVVSRLHQQRKRDEATASTSMALVVVKDTDLRAAEQRLAPDMVVKSRRIVRPDSDSWTKGVMAGRTISINPALKG